MTQLLKGQVAIITGGTAGIGKAIARKFVSEGASLALIAQNQEKGETFLREFFDAGLSKKEIAFYPCDVSQTKAVTETVNKIVEDFGHVDILVNNAGITADQLLMKMKEEDWNRVIDVNLKSCFNLCQSLVRLMIKRRKGKIVNIGSVVGLVGNAGQVNYAASKAGMIGFTRALAKELGPRNIQVNCVAPGYIKTEMTEKLSDQQKEKILQLIPLERLGEAEEVANLVWFLASSLANYITGQVFAVDGGMTM